MKIFKILFVLLLLSSLLFGVYYYAVAPSETLTETVDSKKTVPILSEPWQIKLQEQTIREMAVKEMGTQEFKLEYGDVTGDQMDEAMAFDGINTVLVYGLELKDGSAGIRLIQRMDGYQSARASMGELLIDEVVWSWDGEKFSF